MKQFVKILSTSSKKATLFARKCIIMHVSLLHVYTRCNYFHSSIYINIYRYIEHYEYIICTTTHIYAHTHAKTLAPQCIICMQYTHAQTHTHINTLTNTLTNTHKHAHKHTHTNTLTTHSQTHTRTNTDTYTHARSQTHTRYADGTISSSLSQLALACHLPVTLEVTICQAYRPLTNHHLSYKLTLEIWSASLHTRLRWRVIVWVASTFSSASRTAPLSLGHCAVRQQALLRSQAKANMFSHWIAWLLEAYSKYYFKDFLKY